MIFLSLILEIVNPINKIAANIRNEILMITSTLRLKFNFLNNHIFFILRELMFVVVEACIDAR
jgi:hypothetical protein